MDVIRPFDPWHGTYCTCPEKYSLNPYTGCGHGCVYCYATYIPRFFQPRRKKDLVKRVQKDLEKLPTGTLISISNSSDPYIPMDEEYRDTRRCLQLLQQYDVRVLIVTKSDLVVQDIEVLRELNVAVTFSIASLKKSVYEKLEPHAPSSQQRFQAIKELTQQGIPVGMRLDPVFPYLTNDEIKDIVRKAASVGVEHVVSSTLKPRYDGWRRFQKVFPEIARKIKPLYFDQGEKIDNAWYLPQGLRKKLMRQVKNACESAGISFGMCREGFSFGTAESCDGSHLIQ